MEDDVAVRLSFGRRELRGPWWALLLTLAGVLLFGALGRWQWQRAAEKRALIAAFAAGGGPTLAVRDAD